MFSNALIKTFLMIDDISTKNKEKIQECIDRYRNAKELPRKLKKKVRKEANSDYCFFVAMDKWNDEVFKF